MCLVQDRVVPLLPPQNRRILEGKSIRSDADIEVVLVVPPLPKFPSTFGVAVVAEDLETREELLKLHFPVQNDARRDDDQMRTPYPSIRGKMSQQSDSLDGLPEAWRYTYTSERSSTYEGSDNLPISSERMQLNS